MSETPRESRTEKSLTDQPSLEREPPRERSLETDPAAAAGSPEVRPTAGTRRRLANRGRPVIE